MVGARDVREVEGEELEVGDCGIDFDELVGSVDAHVLEEGVLDLGGLEGVENDEEGVLLEEGEVVAGAARVEPSAPKLSETYVCRKRPSLRKTLVNSKNKAEWLA